jgi:hypothetical protein
MSASLKANEPSMEEILASIRRIIAEDTSPADAPAAPQALPDPEPAQAGPAEEDTDVLDLASIGPAPEPEDDVEFREIAEPLIITKAKEPEPAPEPATRPAAALPPAEPDGEGLLSPAVAAAVSSAFVSLGSLHVPQGGHTLEDLVKEMLRPMLKAWLDENLPGLVENLVRAEIERLSRAPRS